VVQLAQLEINDETGEALARVARRRGQSVDDVLRSLLGVPDDHANANNAEQAGFDRVWERIRDLAGTEFATRNGQRFSYVVDGSYVAPSTSDVRIPVSQFRKAFAIGPVRGPASFRGVFAPSIVWAVLNDERMRGAVSEAVSPQASGHADVIASEGPVSDEGATIAGHTWPDDSGADVPELSSVGRSPDRPQAVEAPAPAQDDVAMEPSLAVASITQAPESASVPPVAAPVVPEERRVQTADQEARGFFKRIFGGR
jgi:hypothetical protein